MPVLKLLTVHLPESVHREINWFSQENIFTSFNTITLYSILCENAKLGDNSEPEPFPKFIY